MWFLLQPLQPLHPLKTFHPFHPLHHALRYEELWVLFSFISGDRVGTKKDFTGHYGKALRSAQSRTATPYQLRRRAEVTDRHLGP